MRERVCPKIGGNAHQKYGPPLLGREDTISAIAMPCTGMRIIRITGPHSMRLRCQSACCMAKTGGISQLQ